MRSLVLALALVATQAHAGPPRGKRAERRAPDRVVVVESECRTREGAFTLRPGVAVTVGRSLGRARKTLEVHLAGDVAGTCWIASEALGLRVARDVSVQLGGATAGDVYTGALVRPRRDGTVETVGAVRARVPVPDDALTAEPREFVYRQPPVAHFVTPHAETSLYAKPQSVGTNAPPIATIDGGVEVVLLEQSGATAKVRTHGPVELEGWALNKQFADRGSELPEAALLKPTHEVFTGAALYLRADGKSKLATLRGGTLVELNDAQGARVKVTTTGRVIASGWLARDELRELRTD